MSTNFGSGLHVAPGQAVDTLAYDRYLGWWSRPILRKSLASLLDPRKPMGLSVFYFYR